MVHQRDEPEPITMLFNNRRHCGKSQSVNQHQGAIVNRLQLPRRVFERRRLRFRKAIVQLNDINLPAQVAEP